MGESKITVERGNGEREGYKELKDEARSVQKEGRGNGKKKRKVQTRTGRKSEEGKLWWEIGVW